MTHVKLSTYISNKTELTQHIVENVCLPFTASTSPPFIREGIKNGRHISIKTKAYRTKMFLIKHFCIQHPSYFVENILLKTHMLRLFHASPPTTPLSTLKPHDSWSQYDIEGGGCSFRRQIWPLLFTLIFFKNIPIRISTILITCVVNYYIGHQRWPLQDDQQLLNLGSSTDRSRREFIRNLDFLPMYFFTIYY